VVVAKWSGVAPSSELRGRTVERTQVRASFPRLVIDAESYRWVRQFSAKVGQQCDLLRADLGVVRADGGPQTYYRDDKSTVGPARPRPFWAECCPGLSLRRPKFTRSTSASKAWRLPVIRGIRLRCLSTAIQARRTT
jgi:hypothetical protein